MIDFTQLTPRQINVMQVAMDHMIEHLEELANESVSFQGNVHELLMHLENVQRLIAAKQIKEALV